MNYLDRNEFNFEPSQKVVEAIKNFDPKTLCFYTRIYDQGKKSVISVRLSEIYGVPEEQVLLTYGGEDMLKNAIHYFLMVGDNKKILIPEFSWWYYNRVASECGGTFEMYPLHEQDDTFAYDIDEVIEYTNRVHPRMLLLAAVSWSIFPATRWYSSTRHTPASSPATPTISPHWLTNTAT